MDDLVDDPATRSATISSFPSRREAFAASIVAVLESHRAIATAHAAHAVLVEKARVAGAALHSRDSFTGGPRWSSDMVAERQITTELAVALHQSEGDTRRLLHTAEGLTGAFAATCAALEAGAISYRHAEKIVHHGRALPEARLLAYESALLPLAREVTAQRLEKLARAAVEEAQPTTAIQRHIDAAAGRRLYLDPAADGMAYLTHYLPAVEAVAIYNRATDLAKSAKNAGDPRTPTQLRVDTLTDLMLNGETNIDTVATGIRARINVTVPVLTLLGNDQPASASSASSSGTGTTGNHSSSKAGDNPTHDKPAAGDKPADDKPANDSGPANLEGYGPIDRLTALELTRDAPHFRRVLTDPITGCALSYGREKYKPPADLDELIRLTHTECTFPLSCDTSATADLDHTIAWSDGGETNFDNISPLCTSHHKVKHHTEWTIQQSPSTNGQPGTITWTSPAGFEYIVEPTPIAKPMTSFTEDPGGQAPPPSPF
ncbi:HNH endonuclease signature motif containing protein [soil metagenome]